MKGYIIKQTIYSIRWQLSTPILAIVPIAMANMGWLHYGSMNFWIAAFVSNFIGSFIFYWIDKWIFRKEQDK